MLCSEHIRMLGIIERSEMHKELGTKRDLNDFTGDTSTQSHKSRHLGW